MDLYLQFLSPRCASFTIVQSLGLWVVGYWIFEPTIPFYIEGSNFHCHVSLGHIISRHMSSQLPRPRSRHHVMSLPHHHYWASIRYCIGLDSLRNPSRWSWSSHWPPHVFQLFGTPSAHCSVGSFTGFSEPQQIHIVDVKLVLVVDLLDPKRFWPSIW